jgi:hypothetical protein
MRLLFPLLLTLAYSAHAATLADCRAVADAGSRLACYDALPLPGAVAAAAPAATPAPAPAPASTFGLPQRSDAEPKFIESRIEGHFEGWRAGGTIKLANGQTWQVTDEAATGYNLDNPKVRVTKGFMGSHFLEIEGVNFTPRVKRIQ